MTDDLRALAPSPRERRPGGLPDSRLDFGGPRPPQWVGDLFERISPERFGVDGAAIEVPMIDRPIESLIDGASRVRIEVRDAGALGLTTVVVEDAVLLDAEGFEAATARAYRLVLEQLESMSAQHPVRVWNFIPEILAPLGDQPHRYMAFNAGRYRAYRHRYDSPGHFPTNLATASGTGHRGADLVIHCLSSISPGRPLENPRQIPAYRYSQRWGPMPPCFARATLASLGPSRPDLLLVGGTASVRGEASEHPGDLDAQFEETVSNLEALIQAATASVTGLATKSARASARPLSHYRDLRVYHPDPALRSTIESAIASRFDRLRRIEYVPCDLCRPELLIEIEGVAEL